MRLFDIRGLTLSLLASIAAFLPFALQTSPWNAVTLNVPGNQGNWWHALIGAPFFLAFPMLWLHLRGLLSKPIGVAERRFMWVMVVLAACSTIVVEIPFLLQRAGTSGIQRFAIIGSGFGILLAGGAALILRPISRACIAGLRVAYLANAAICLIIYSGAHGTWSSKSGWLLTMIIVWPMALELVWMLAH